MNSPAERKSICANLLSRLTASDPLANVPRFQTTQKGSLSTAAFMVGKFKVWLKSDGNVWLQDRLDYLEKMEAYRRNVTACINDKNTDTMKAIIENAKEYLPRNDREVPIISCSISMFCVHYFVLHQRADNQTEEFQDAYSKDLRSWSGSKGRSTLRVFDGDRKPNGSSTGRFESTSFGPCHSGLPCSPFFPRVCPYEHNRCLIVTKIIFSSKSGGSSSRSPPLPVTLACR